MSNPHVSFDPRDAGPLAILEDQERPLIWVDPIAHQAELDEAWDDGYAAAVDDRRGRVVGLVLAALSGAILAAAITAALAHAAPRTAQLAIPAAVSSTEGGASGTDAGQSGAPRVGMPVEARAEASRAVATPVAEVGAPPPTDEGEVGTAMESGIVAYAAPGLGSRYLALPEGPGHRVTICTEDSTRCLDRTSTDAGPDLAMQRRGRIADLSFADFAWLCRCDPPTLGTMQATIERAGAGPTPPATDTEP